MKAFISLALLSAVSAIPAPQGSDPVRILPYNWDFTITALNGPGCPDFGADPEKAFATRPTYGQNTVDGSEIYYWFFAYPHLFASLEKGKDTASSWCETTIKYREFKDSQRTVEASDYKLRLNKNGTMIMGTYELEEGTEAKWDFVYNAGEGSKVVESLVVPGPLNTQVTWDVFNTNTGVLNRWELPSCGSGEIKFRTTLTVTAKKAGAKGRVTGQTPQYIDETTGVGYGVQQGISYDWEKCKA